MARQESVHGNPEKTNTVIALNKLIMPNNTYETEVKDFNPDVLTNKFNHSEQDFLHQCYIRPEMIDDMIDEVLNNNTFTNQVGRLAVITFEIHSHPNSLCNICYNMLRAFLMCDKMQQMKTKVLNRFHTNTCVAMMRVSSNRAFNSDDIQKNNNNLDRYAQEPQVYDKGTLDGVVYEQASQEQWATIEGKKKSGKLFTAR